jgi:ferritin-like metal-binding protein YciE
VKLFSANIEDFRTLYITNLQKALDMEQTIVKALPDVINNVSDADLSVALQNHLEETKGHAAKVESLLQQHTGDAKTETCKAIHGLATEASDTIKDVTDPSIRDIALIGAAQQVEHHEIAVYGTLKNWARLLGLTQDAAVLEAIESQEFNADAHLTQLSTRINAEAPYNTPAYR